LAGLLAVALGTVAVGDFVEAMATGDMAVEQADRWPAIGILWAVALIFWIRRTQERPWKGKRNRAGCIKLLVFLGACVVAWAMWGVINA
jgi:hypothetical protein